MKLLRRSQSRGPVRASFVTGLLLAAAGIGITGCARENLRYTDANLRKLFFICNELAGPSLQAPPTQQEVRAILGPGETLRPDDDAVKHLESEFRDSGHPLKDSVESSAQWVRWERQTGSDDHAIIGFVSGGSELRGAIQSVHHADGSSAYGAFTKDGMFRISSSAPTKVR